MDARIQAEFQSVAEDSDGKRIDVLENLIKHHQATYQMTVQGESMREVGIFNGDVVFIDKAIVSKECQEVVIWVVVVASITVHRN